MQKRRYHSLLGLSVRLGACVLLLSAAACSRTATGPATVTTLAPRTTAQDLFERSPVRLRIRSFAPQAWRLAEPNWSRVPERERGRVQSVFLTAFSERSVAPLAERRFQAAAQEPGTPAEAALEWWKRGEAAEIKFAEATASRPDPSSKQEFMARYAAVSEDNAPEVRMSRIRRLAAATDAVRSTLDLTHAIGHAVARVVNQVLPPAQRLDGRRLAETIREERSDRKTVQGYEAVVLASMLQRYSQVALEDLDAYVAFAESEAGRWYHRVAWQSLVGAAEEAGRDIERTLAQTDPTEPVIDSDALELALPSGRSVRMLGVSGMRYQAMAAVVVRYETSVPISDLTAVRREADEVWARVRNDVEAMGSKAVVLQATGSVAGWVFTTASSRSFAWRRGDDGWEVVRGGLGGDRPSLESLHSETLWSVPP